MNARLLNCPVCNAPAVDIGAKDFDGKVFRCSAACKDYEISGSQLLSLLAKDRTERADSFARAVRLASPGVRPRINSLSL
jgi:hypothetical protein